MHRLIDIEFVYPDHVSQYRDFLLAEIRRVHESAQVELTRLRIVSPEVIQATHRRVIEQCKPLEDELVRLLSRSTWNVVLSSQRSLNPCNA